MNAIFWLFTSRVHALHTAYVSPVALAVVAIAASVFKDRVGKSFAVPLMFVGAAIGFAILPRFVVHHRPRDRIDAIRYELSYLEQQVDDLFLLKVNRMISQAELLKRKKYLDDRITVLMAKLIELFHSSTHREPFVQHFDTAAGC